MWLLYYPRLVTDHHHNHARHHQESPTVPLRTTVPRYLLYAKNNLSSSSATIQKHILRRLGGYPRHKLRSAVGLATGCHGQSLVTTASQWQYSQYAAVSRGLCHGHTDGTCCGTRHGSPRQYHGNSHGDLHGNCHGKPRSAAAAPRQLPP